MVWKVEPVYNKPVQQRIKCTGSVWLVFIKWLEERRNEY